MRIEGRGGLGRLAIRLASTLAIGMCVALAEPRGMALAAESPPATTERFDTIVIDAGHGGDDQGARGPKGLVEKELVLDVGRRVAARLRDAGLRAVLTRSDDRFVGLEERTSIANDARADLFVSIHANGSEERAARGIETFFVSLDASDESARALALEENRSFATTGGPTALEGDPLFAILGDMIATEHLVDSQEFARLALGELLAAKGAVSRGVKQAPFVVLMGVQMPAALVEIGFITNAREESALATAAERERIAGSLAKAILDFGRRFDAKRGVAAQGGD